MHIVAKFVTEDLNFNVPGKLNVLFDQHFIISKAFHTFTLGGLKLLKELRLILDDTHAFTAATKNGFEHDREADFLRLFKKEFSILLLAMIAFDHWHRCRFHYVLGLTLGTHGLNC